MKRIYIILLIIFALSDLKAQIPFPIGATAPDFTAVDIHGNTHHLYEYLAEGKYVLVDFFAYWCSTCLVTAPKTDQFYHKYGCNQGNVIVLGNECDGTNAQMIAFKLQAGLDTSDTYPSWSGVTYGGAIGNIYNPAAFPTIILIGPDSTILQYDIWPIPNVAAIEARFPAGVLVPVSCYTNVAENENLLSHSIYPNPAQDEFFTSLTLNKPADVKIELHSLLGQILQVKNIDGLLAGDHNIRMDLQGIPTGTFLVRVLIDGMPSFTGKLHKL